MNSVKKTIVIIGEGFSFPNGMAATNRVKNIAKGLANQNFHVSIYCIRGTESISETKNTAQKGQLGTIDYAYTNGSTYRSTNWLHRRWDDFYGMFGGFKRLLLLKIKQRLVVVIVYSRNPSVVYKILLFCRLLNTKVILELCEWPLARNDRDSRRIKRAQNFCNTIVPKVNAVIPISPYIEDRVNLVTRLHQIQLPSITIPILIDDAMYSTAAMQFEKKNTTRYMLYMGSPSYYDIAQIVVDICIELKKRDIWLPVKITGKFNEQKRTIDYANENHVSEYVEIVGYLEEKELIELQQNAELLLAPLPETEQSISRFPTKIGHYLMSGRPVVTTLVGEVSHYLTDGVNAYIATHCTSTNLSDKIEQIYHHPSKATSVGQQGALLAAKMFHYNVHGARLERFIRKLVSTATNHTGS